MPADGVKRRLAAIFAADVAGYSRLMAADEEGTLRRLLSIRAEQLDPEIAGHGGRIVKTTGDGLLVEFASIVDAVRCAVAVQRKMHDWNAALSPVERIEFRIGIHIGDIIAEGDDIYGDGVNVAARLEGIAEPGAICLSRQAFDQVEDKVPLPYRALGAQSLKNIARPVEAFAVAPVSDTPRPPAATLAPLKQEVRYCRARDGVRLAYATIGQGPPLVKTANWMNHLEFEWDCLVWRHFFHRLAREHTLLRYDARGNGLSDWEAEDVSLDAWVGDLETVVDREGLDRFPLLAISQGGAVAITYAVRHPERVSRLVIYGGFAAGRWNLATSDAEREQIHAMVTLARAGWSQENAGFRQLFTSQLMPDATKEETDSFNELQRKTTSADCAARYMDVVGKIDVRDLLPRVAVPTLVVHARDDFRAPLEGARAMAAGIPGARFVVLQSKNHILLEHHSAPDRFFEELRLFLAQ
jgi:class 3 adenylate cyclase/pimeloyl-ACP methyl ester carboxylesterase